jgi:putative acetyltransferase
MTRIREEKPDDIAAIRKVNELAFGQPSEAEIVDQLRKNCPDLLSLVAVEGKEVVGYSLFSPARIEGDGRTIEGMGLAPTAVLPAWQRKGIGSLLIREGIRILKERDCPFIIVLGHPEYYPRFGFDRASAHGIRSQWDGVPDEAFMILILNRSVMAGVCGTAYYQSEFDEVAD